MDRREKFFSKANILCETAIKSIALAIVIFLTVLTSIWQTMISFDILETSIITKNGPWFFVILLMSVMILPMAMRLLKHIPEGVLFGIFAVIYLFVGVYLINNIQMLVRGDSEICINNAIKFITDDYSGVQFGEYLYKNPHQIGLVSYFRLLMVFSKEHNFIFVINLLWILLTNFFLWQSGRLVYEESPLARKVLIFLSFAFLPQFFYLFFAYGNVPGLGCVMIALYLTIRTLKKDCKWCMVLSFVFVALACIIRMNYIIAGIAIILVYLLKWLQRRRILYLMAIVCMLCCMLLPSRILTRYYEGVADTDLNKGMPSVLYIAMGLQENFYPWRAAGWYNYFNDNTYKDNNCDVEVCTEIAMESIQERVSTFVSDPEYAYRFFGEKLITTWCEPTFQSIWSGPLISQGCYTEVAVLQDLYSGGRSYHLLVSVLNILCVNIFFFSTIYIARKLFLCKEALNTLELFALMFFVGGFLFHFVWETKSQYVYSYFLFLLPLAASGIQGCKWTKLLKLIHRKQKRDIS